MIIRYPIALLLILVLLATSPSHADWINLSGAETSRNIIEVYVEENRVRLVLEVYVGDLEVFEDLVPDSFLKRKNPSRASLAERIRRFSSQTLRVVTETGEALPATLLKVDPRLRKDRYSPFAGMVNPITRRRVAKPPADKRVLYAELSYDFGGMRPKTLTLVPPLDKNGRARVTIGFIVYHKSVPVIDFRYLGAPAKLSLNWDDPWYSKFDNPNLKRHHKDALMSFLYIEPREVRHEVLVRVRDLQDWTDLGLKGGAMIRTGEQAPLKKRVQAFFEAHNPLRIDGKPYKPASSQVAFLNISLRGLQLVEEDKPLDLSTAIMGVILSYPVKHLPKNVSVKWELFNPRIDRIPTTATDPVGPLKSYIDRENPTIVWKNFLRKYVEPKVAPVEMDAGHSFGVPIASLILVLGALIAIGLVVRPRYFSRYAWAGASLICVVGAVLLIRATVVEVSNPFSGPPAEAAAARIITAVLDNVHTAYLERTEPELTQALSVVVAEGGFTDIKAELNRALAINVAGGGIARVNKIEGLVVKDVAAIDGRSGFRSVVEWLALARAGHWGHSHRRRIRFRALMELQEIEGAWKLAGLTIVDARQENRAR
ncbi:MAG: hypothetical protein V3S36_06380 [Acidiferrobacterales bacterium]